MSVLDRLKDNLLALTRVSTPHIDRFALYRARVVSQSADLAKVDVQPDDMRLPGMSGVPLKLGLPGARVSVSPGAYVLIGWEGGNGQRRYACLWEGGESVVKLTFVADMIEIGAAGLGLNPLVNGVVLASGIDTLTGVPYGTLGSGSLVVTAKKS